MRDGAGTQAAGAVPVSRAAELRRHAGRLTASVNETLALCLAVRVRLGTWPAEDEAARRGAELLATLGITEAVEEAEPADLASVLAGLRADLLFAAALLSEDAAPRRWRARDAAILRAFGDVSAGFPALLRRHVLPQLAGLAERLERPGAAFLDIGAGVGALSLAMLREWPALRVVAVEKLPEACALAGAAIRDAGAEAHVELHAGRAQELEETAAFDLAFVPSAFIPPAELPSVTARAAAALRPGGWLLLAVLGGGADAAAAALTRFRIAAWGGTSLGGEAAEAVLRGAGLGDVRVLPGAGGAIGFAAARRPDG